MIMTNRQRALLLGISSKGRPMSREQRKILQEAPRFRFHDAADWERSVIPDTEKAREWAIAKCGAKRLSGGTFHCVGPDGLLAGSRFGDFCAIFEDAEAVGPLDSGKFEKESADFCQRILGLLLHAFNVPFVDCRCTILSPDRIELKIPSDAFGAENDCLILEDVYDATASLLQSYGSSFKMDVMQARMTYIENVQLESGTFAVPIMLAELLRGSISLRNLALTPRRISEPTAKWLIDAAIMQKLLAEAKRRWDGGHKKIWWRQKPDPEIILNLTRGLSRNRPQDSLTQQYAWRLIAWKNKHDLTEFSQRNASRALGTRLNGKLGNGGGVADALRILISANYIHEGCLPVTKYQCKPPSPWFFVNPL